MQAFLEEYSLANVAVIIIILGGLFPNYIDGIKKFVSGVRTFFRKGFADEQHDREVDQRLQETEKFYKEKDVVDRGFEQKDREIAELNAKISNLIEGVNGRVDMLVESDKEAIKAYITERHHHFCYDMGWIDDYNLECLERRFAVYKEEHGNSFVGGLMAEIRDLPRRPPAEDEGKFANTNRYVKRDKKSN